MYRDSRTLCPILYYNKLPGECDADVTFVLDPMIATCACWCPQGSAWTVPAPPAALLTGVGLPRHSGHDQRHNRHRQGVGLQEHCHHDGDRLPVGNRVPALHPP